MCPSRTAISVFFCDYSYTISTKIIKAKMNVTAHDNY